MSRSLFSLSEMQFARKLAPFGYRHRRRVRRSLQRPGRNSRQCLCSAELLEDRTLLAVDAFGPLVDGYATDTNKDGTFPNLTTTSNDIRVRDYPNSAGYPGDDRGLLEFDVSSLGVGLTVDAAEFRLRTSAGYGGSVATVDVFAYAADGVLTSADATSPATLVGSAVLNIGSSHTVSLDAATIQTLYDSSSILGIRLVVSSSSAAFGFGAYSSEGTPASFPQYEPTLTLTTSGTPAPSLAVNLGATSVAENAGAAAVSGTVQRLNADTSADLVVTLSTSDANEAFPTQASVTIPANATSASFTIDAVDDALLDGDQPVTISATATGLVSGNASLLVTDFETLSVVAAQSPIVENAGAGATTVTITRPNTDNSLPLTVTLTDTSPRLTLPATAEIPANEASVTVPVDVIDTEQVDGNTTVTIRANAPGYQQGQTTIVVEDDDGGMIRPGNILVAVDDRYVREYKPNGTLIQTFSVFPQGSQLSDVVVNGQGDIEVINGNSVLTNIDVETKATTNRSAPDWAVGGNVFAGGVATLGQYVFVSDTGTSKGVVRFDTANGYAVSRANTTFDVFDVAVGLNGLLYALESGGGGNDVAVINPLTMQVLNTITLQPTTHWGIAVNAAGEIFATGWQEALYKYDSQGKLIDYLVTGYPLKDIDIDSTGRIVAAGSATSIPYGYVVITNEAFQDVNAFSVTSGLEVFVAFADPDSTTAAPAVTTSGTAATLTEDGASTASTSVIIDPALTLTDDGNVMTGAVVRITGNYRKGQDSLSGFSQNGILYQGFNSKTGTITFSGTATVDDYQAALRSVRYHNNSNSPDTNPRTITFSAIDEGWIGSAETTVNVVSANDGLPVAINDSYTVDQDGVLTIEPVVTHRLTLQSDTGEWVGQGNNYVLTGSGLTIAQQYGTNGVRFDYEGTTDWNVNLWADVGPLSVGSYPVATRNGSNGSALIDISGNGRGSGRHVGSFEVREIEYDTSNTLIRFAAEFIQYTESETAALRGTIDYRSTHLTESGVLLNDSDSDAILRVTGTTTPLHGTLVMQSNGAFVYTPNPGYHGADAFDYTVTDSDGATTTATVTINVEAPPVPGVTISNVPPTGLAISESGTSAAFGVVLDIAPTSNVTLTVTSDDPTEALVDKATLLFTPANWDTVQTVTVTAVNDFLIDGLQSSTITIAVDDAISDDLYDPLPDVTVDFSTTDDDVAGFTVTEYGGVTSVNESGTTDSISVKLNAEPAGDVVLMLTSSDPDEVTVGTSMLTFTPANWNTLQFVALTGIDDSIIDGDQASVITVSVDDVNSDDDFDPLADFTISVITVDDDIAGITVTETSGGTLVSETGTNDTFTVVLDAQPTTSVVLTVTSGDTGEATVAPATLTFTSLTWNQPQTVTVTGIDDALYDAAQTTLVTVRVDDTASDDAFDAVADQTVSVVTTDDELAALQGTKFEDVNGNGQRDAGEGGLSGVTIYLDLNDNGVLDNIGEIGLEPDNHPNMNVSNVRSEFTLTAEYLTGQTGPVSATQVVSGSTSTGQYAFGYDPEGYFAWSGSPTTPSRLRIDMNSTVESIALDFTAATASAIGLLQAYDSSGNLLASQTTTLLPLDVSASLTVFAPGMAYAIATSTGNEFVVLDNLRVTSAIEPSAITDGAGDYIFTNVSGGEYVVREVVPEGYRQTFPLFEAPRLFAVDPNASTASRIVEVDPVTGTTLATFTVPGDSSGLTGGLAYDGSSLFFVDSNTDTLYKLNPDTGTVLATLSLNTAGRWDGLAALNGSIYVNDPFTDVIEVVDPATMTVTSTIQLSGSSNFNPFGGLGELPDSSGGQLIGAVGSSSIVALLNPVDGSVNSTFTHASVSGGDNFGLTSLNGEIYLGFNDAAGTVLVYTPGGTLVRSFQTGFDMSGLGGESGASGSHLVTIDAPLISGIDFGNKQQVGNISGRKFIDLNGNGAQDAGEGGLSGVTIYLDTNDNAVFDPGELSSTTTQNGDYTFTDVPIGDYSVREVIPSGYVQTSPGYSDSFFFGNRVIDEEIVTINALSGEVTVVGQHQIGSQLQGLAYTNSGRLIGSSWFTDDLYDIDTATGIGTLIGNYTGHIASALAYDHASDTIYGFVFSNGTRLARFDQTTGLPTIITGALAEFDNVTAAAFDPATGHIIAFDNADDQFLDIEPSTGAVTVLSVAAQPLHSFSMTHTGSAFVMPPNSGVLETVDPYTGVRSHLLTLSEAAFLDGIEFVRGNDGSHRIKLNEAQTITGLDFANQPDIGDIHGSKFEDANGNGIQDTGEGPLADIIVYLDANDNAMFDTGELSTLTNSSGDYSFIGVPSGDYIVREIVPTGYVQTTPAHSEEFYYGINYSTDELVHISAVSGIITTIGPHNAPVDLTGMVYTNTGQLFASSWQDDRFYSINPATGLATEIGHAGGQIAGGMGYDSSTNTIYGAVQGGAGTRLAKFDPATGKATAIGPGVANLTGTAGVAFDPVSGKVIVYDIQGDEFFGFDPVTGVGSVLSIASPDLAILGLTSNGTDVLLAYQSQIFALDIDTGQRTSQLTLSSGAIIEGLEHVAAQDGSHRITISAGDVINDVDFGNRLAVGEIRGTSFHDLNANGVRDVGEGPLVDATIFLDANDNGVLDTGEASVLTDGSGDYVFTDVPIGDHVVREFIPTGFANTSPGHTDAVFYVVDGTTHEIVSVNAATGDVTRIGPHNAGVLLDSLAWTRDGQLIAGTAQNPDRMFTIDIATGVATEIGITGGNIDPGLAYDPATDRLYSVTTTGSISRLTRIDPVTGQQTTYGPGVAGLSYAAGVAFDTNSGTVIAFDNTSDTFFSFDPATGAGSLLSTMTSAVNSWGLTYVGSDLILPLIGTQFVAANPLTGSQSPYLTLSESVSTVALTYDPGKDGAHRITVGTGQVAGGLDFGNRRLPLQVADVKVNSPTWQADFRDVVDGEAIGSGLGTGYSIPTGATDQTTPLPWSNLRQLIVAFTTDIDPSTVAPNSNVRLHGTLSAPTISGITVTGSQMVIDLATGLTTDSLRLEIQDTVLSIAGEPLDGDFVNENSTMSGGTAPVGDPANNFNFHLVTNPGDANRSGVVNISDAIMVFQNFFAASGDAGYSVFVDMTGDAILNISDAIVVFQNFFASPPGSFPGAFQSGSSFPEHDAPLVQTIPTAKNTPAVQRERSSVSHGQPPASTSAPPATPPASGGNGSEFGTDLEVLDQVLASSVGDILPGG